MNDRDSDQTEAAPDESPAAAASQAQEGEAAERAGDVGPAPRSTGGVWLVLCFLLLLAVIATAGGGAFYWYHNIYRVAQTDLAARIDHLEQSQRATDGQIGTVSASADAMKTAQSELDAAVDSVQRRQTELEKSVAALYERGAETSLDWILAEAEYLVLAANQRLALEGDVHTAAAALRSADERLEAADHPDLIPVREQLIKDIGALEAVKLPDSEGLALYFAEVVARVADLPTKPIADLGPPFSSVKNEDHSVENWRNLLRAVWDDLVNLVEVKDAELPDSVLFDPELRYFLQQNLRLELASARLAVLRRDTANLRASTSLLKRLLTTYYDVDDAAVGAIVKRLDAAATVELAPELPDISGSLDKIRGYRAARARTGEEAVPVAAGSVP